MVKKQNSICEICEKRPSIYKCPKCLKKYCSALCFKNHNNTDNHNQNQNVNRSKSNEDDQFDDVLFKTYDTIPKAKLQLLKTNSQLKDILRNKHLRKAILEVYKSNNPNQKIEQFMKCKIFEEFVDICLKSVENK